MISALRSSRHSAGIAGATTSSAASAMSKKSMPVLTPILSNTPISASTGALPAPAPNRRQQPSICLAPARTASTRVGHAEPEVLVAVKTDLRVVAEFGDQRRDPVGDALEHQRTGRVDHVDALAAGVGHDAGLRRPASPAGWCGSSSGTRRSPGRARGPARSAGSTRRPRCSGWRSGRSSRRCSAPP